MKVQVVGPYQVKVDGEYVTEETGPIEVDPAIGRDWVNRGLAKEVRAKKATAETKARTTAKNKSEETT